MDDRIFKTTYFMDDRMFKTKFTLILIHFRNFKWKWKFLEHFNAINWQVIAVIRFDDNFSNQSPGKEFKSELWV